MLCWKKTSFPSTYFGPKPAAKALRMCLLPLFCVLDHPGGGGRATPAFCGAAIPHLMPRSGGRRNSGCSLCREGLGGSLTPLPCSLALQSSTFPSHPAAFPALRSAFMSLSRDEGISVIPCPGCCWGGASMWY